MTLLLSLPDHVLITLMTYLKESDWMSVGLLNRFIAYGSKNLWVMMYKLKFELINKVKTTIKKKENINDGIKKQETRVQRNTRSESNPRLAFFNALRNRMYAFDNCSRKIVNILRHSDSPASLEKISLPDFPYNRLFVPCDDSTILCAAVRFDRWRCVKYLVLNCGCDLNVQGILL